MILACEARESHTPAGLLKRLSPFSLAIFTLAPDLSFEHLPSLAFEKNTTVLQSIFEEMETAAPSSVNSTEQIQTSSQTNNQLCLGALSIRGKFRSEFPEFPMTNGTVVFGIIRKRGQPCKA